MRSLLIVPAGSTRKLEEALTSDADAILIDLEDSVSWLDKTESRANAAGFLAHAKTHANRPRLFVRVNGLSSGLTDLDRELGIEAGAEGIFLPKCNGGRDVTLLDAKIAVREAYANLPDGGVPILAIGTETAFAVLNAASYRGSSSRLVGLAWSIDKLAIELGAFHPRADGALTDTLRLARSLTLLAAVSAGIAPIDAAQTNFLDEAAFKAACEEAARDGFTAKLAVHPAQIAIINETFTPSGAAVAVAARIVEAARMEAGQLSTALFDGRPVETQQLKQAEAILARAALAQNRQPLGRDSENKESTTV